MAALLLGPLGLLRGQGQESQQGDAGQRPPNTACVELENFANAQYTAAMQIGSPAQTLKMIPDSGSSDLVVPSADCGAEDGCIGSQHSKFDAQRSSTSQGPFGLVDVAYGQGETECEIIRDVARLDSLQVDQQDMLLVTTNRLAGYEYAMYDGILGLGTDKEARKGTPSFLTALPSADKFTICIGSRNKENGILMFGNATIDVLDWSPILSFPARAIYTGDIPFWGVYMSSIKMSDGFSVDCQPSCAAVIDSGTSLMSLPSVMVYSLLDQIGNDYNADCSNVAAKLPNIVLTLEGQKFYLRPQDYMVVVDSDDLTDTGLINPISYDKLSTSTQRIGPFGVAHLRPRASQFSFTNLTSRLKCTPAFVELDELTNRGQMVILGIPFLRSYATTFDRGDGKSIPSSISFARVDDTPGVCSKCPSATTGLYRTPTSPPHDHVAGDGDDNPVQINMSALRFPWWSRFARGSNHSVPSQLIINRGQENDVEFNDL